VNESSLSYNLTPVGYLIVRDPKEFFENDAYCREFGRYFGVDRLPGFFPPDRDIRQLIGESPVEDEDLRIALKDWFDCRSKANAFIENYFHAFCLFKTFQSFGVRLELLYCQVALQEGEGKRLECYAPVTGSPQGTLQEYGFDVSWPSCNHSAIFQPGIVPNCTTWRSKLNQYGLLNDYSDALSLRQEYLAIYPYPPFDIYLIHAVM
jgi:hypothetical protein